MCRFFFLEICLVFFTSPLVAGVGLYQVNGFEGRSCHGLHKQRFSYFTEIYILLFYTFWVLVLHVVLYFYVLYCLERTSKSIGGGGSFSSIGNNGIGLGEPSSN